MTNSTLLVKTTQTCPYKVKTIKLILTILSVFVSVSHAATSVGMQNTNFAWPTNWVGDTYRLTAFNTSNPTPFKQVQLTVGSLFSNRTAYGNWNFPGITRIEEFRANSGRVTNNFYCDGIIAMAGATVLLQADASTVTLITPNRIGLGDRTRGFSGDSGGVLTFQSQVGQSLVSLRASRLVSGIDGLWFYGGANLNHSNDVVSSYESFSGIGPVITNSAGKTQPGWIEARGASNAPGNFRAVILGSTTHTNSGNFTNSGTAAINQALIVGGGATFNGGVNSTVARGAALTGITVGASPFNWTNNSSFGSGNVMLYISGGTVTEVDINGSAVFATSTTGVSTISLQANEYVTVTYSSAPTMRFKDF